MKVIPQQSTRALVGGKMWLFNIVLLSCLLVAQGKSVTIRDEPDEPELKWPEQYTFQATKIYLLAGITENYQVWQAPNVSRVDLNNGAVKTFKNVVENKGRGIKYEIHPEADKDQNTKLVCKKTKGSIYDNIRLDNILPDIDNGYEAVEKELLNGEESTKFVGKSTYGNTYSEYTLWAVYKSDKEMWIPIRSEEKETNTWLGILDSHVIWEFNNFNTDVDDKDFNTEEYCENATEYDINDKEVTEYLMFLDPEVDAHVEHAFEAFKKKHKRNYFNEEHAMRKAIFKKNMRLVTRTNRMNRGFKLAVNQFADRTEAEMIKHKGLLARPKGASGNLPFPYSAAEMAELVKSLPKEYDSRLDGLVSPVKHQETCGSCWTYGTTAAMEGALARSAGKLITLSNQALVDCAWAYGSSGCDGGFDTSAYKWMQDYGLPTEAEYGMYTNSDGFCRIKNMTKVYSIRGFTDVSPYSVDALKIAVINHGPLSVSVDANNAFSLYSSGIFYDASCDPSDLNHEVALVGYGEQDGETYWILKNSWGQQWGLDGYMHISSKDNNCGVATEPTYVVV